MPLIEELKRRNVFKVAAAYAAVAWMFLELSALALNAFSAPVWVMKVVIFFAVAGFAVAVLLAWAFELTPEGIKRTSDLGDTPTLPAPRSRKWTTITISALALALMLVIVDAYVLRDSPAAAEDATLATPALAAVADTADTAVPTVERSLVVLPFENLSDDASQAYFADGLTEELINTLSAIDGLLVTSRSSAYAYQDSPLSLREIGALLNVRHVLQGSVRKAGTQLRIAVTLTEATTDFNLWTKSWDRELDDIFVLQDEIAAAVATALSVTLGAGSFDRPGMTRNVEAYDEYLQASQHLRLYEVLNAIVHAERAVALDPEFALGWRRLAAAYGRGVFFLPTDQSVGYAEKQQEAASRAAALAPEMAELDLDVLDEMWANGDFVGTERFFEEYGSTYDLDIRFNLTRLQFLHRVGRYDEGVRFGQKAYQLYPTSGEVPNYYARNLLNARAEAGVTEAEIARGLGFGESPALYAIRAFLEIDRGNWESALAVTQSMVVSREVQSRMLQYLIDDKPQEGVAELRRLLDDATLAPALRGRHLPVFAALLGEPELALAFMRSWGERVPDMDMGLELFSVVRRHPDFKAYVEERGLLKYWRTTGNWADYCRPVNDDFECF